MASKTLLVLCFVAVVFAIAYAAEAARDMVVDSNDAGHVADDKANGIEDAKHGYPGHGGSSSGAYPGRGGSSSGGYPGQGGPGGGGKYSGGRRDSCRYGCCGRRDYNGVCQRCCPHVV